MSKEECDFAQALAQDQMAVLKRIEALEKMLPMFQEWKRKKEKSIRDGSVHIQKNPSHF